MQFIDLIKQYEKISDHIELHINNVLNRTNYMKTGKQLSYSVQKGNYGLRYIYPDGTKDMFDEDCKASNSSL